MNRTMLGLCMAAAFGFAVNAGAQTTPTTTNPSQSTMSQDKNEVTVTGCLERGADGNFILTNASVEPSSGYGQSTTGTTGSTAETGSATSQSRTSSAKSTFKLEGGTNLEQHVGHKVQVTGTTEPKDESESSATSGTSTTGTTGTMANDQTKNARELEVKSVKMISSTCSM